MELDPILSAIDRFDLVVSGAHLSGQPLNRELTDRGAELVTATTTAGSYRLFALLTDPPTPGLVRVTSGGAAIEVEVWSLGPGELASFVAAVPSPLAVGQIELADGTVSLGSTCMPHALEGATDITGWGGWRAYVAAR